MNILKENHLEESSSFQILGASSHHLAFCHHQVSYLLLFHFSALLCILTEKSVVMNPFFGSTSLTALGQGIWSIGKSSYCLSDFITQNTTDYKCADPIVKALVA